MLCINSNQTRVQEEVYGVKDDDERSLFFVVDAVV